MSLPYKTGSTLPYGSRVLTIGAVTFIANNFRTQAPSQLIERKTELGAPNGAVLIEQARTGTAELQLASSSTAAPARGDEFTEDTITWFITEVGKPESVDTFKVVDISFREKV